MIAAALVAVSASPPPPPPLLDGSGNLRPLPQPAVLLFWAAWCAPCRAEVRQIEALTDAAAPIAVIVVSIDNNSVSRALLRGLPPDRVRFPAAAAPPLLTMMPGGGVALPAAMATDASGKTCAYTEGAVNPVMLRQWSARCRQTGGNS